MENMSVKHKIVSPEDKLVFLNDDELDEKIKWLENTITSKADCKTERHFMQYIKKKDIEVDYWVVKDYELKS